MSSGAMYCSAEVAISPAGMSIKFIYSTANPSFSDVKRSFLFSDLATLTGKSENNNNKKRLLNIREGSDYPAAWLT